jgi:peptidoglycan/LPS O-acetylase OafA/YrhL
MFFVLSGYLITSIIVRDIKSEIFKVYEFWRRIILRLIPAYIFFLILGGFLEQKFQH